MFAFANVLDFLADELSRLSARSFMFGGSLPGAFVRHDDYRPPPPLNVFSPVSQYGLTL